MNFQNIVMRINQIVSGRSVSFSFVIIPLFLFSLQVQSQTVENVVATVKEDIIIVSYDLISSSDEVFTVNLYSISR
jgi:flagellar assembly factor FliW